LALEHRPLILAYYRVEGALTAAPRWDQAIRDSLRRAAEGLASETGVADLADSLQTQADRLTPDQRGLQDLAMKLRNRIVREAGNPPFGARK
jgi:hypothetical protein